jgi:hypothetical protein
MRFILHLRGEREHLVAFLEERRTHKVEGFLFEVREGAYLGGRCFHGGGGTHMS